MTRQELIHEILNLWPVITRDQLNSLMKAELRSMLENLRMIDQNQLIRGPIADMYIVRYVMETPGTIYFVKGTVQTFSNGNNSYDFFVPFEMPDNIDEDNEYIIGECAFYTLDEAMAYAEKLRQEHIVGITKSIEVYHRSLERTKSLTFHVKTGDGNVDIQQS